MAKGLFIVDPQIGFCNGSMPVPMAPEDMNALADYMLTTKCQQYDAKIVSVDDHPWNHCSFKPFGGEWEPHCIAHTVDAAIWPALEKALFTTHGETLFIPKGQDVKREEYSIFVKGELADFFGIIERNSITELDVCGIVREICVLNTIKGLHEVLPNMKVNVLMRYTPTLDSGVAFQKFVDENPWLNLIR